MLLPLDARHPAVAGLVRSFLLSAGNPRPVVGIRLLPVGPDQIGEAGAPGHLESEDLLEPRSTEVGRDHDDLASAHRPRGGQIGRHKRLSVTRFRAGDHDERTGCLVEDHPQTGPQFADRLRHCGLGRLHHGDGHRARANFGVFGYLGQDRRLGHRFDVRDRPEPGVELVACQGDPAAHQESGDQADGTEFGLAQPRRRRRKLRRHLDAGVRLSQQDVLLFGLQRAGSLGEGGDLGGGQRL